MKLATLISRVACAAAVLMSGTAGAQQIRASLDAGSSSMRYADSIDVTALSLTPSAYLAMRRASLSATATLSQFSGASTQSGSLSGLVSAPLFGTTDAEFVGVGGGSRHSDGAKTGQLLGIGRLHVGLNRGGAWAGGGLGRTWDGVLWRGVVQGSVGGWATSSLGGAVVSFAPTAVDDTIRYTDATVSLQRAQGRFELGASFGTRLGDPVPTLVTDRVWGSVSAVAWLLPRVGIVASGGTYPIDFTQGFPCGRFLSLALRFSTTRPQVATSDRPIRVFSPGEALAFEIRPVSAGRQRLRVHAPGVRTVEVAGDFTNWRAVALTAEGDGWWGITLPIARGRHEINLRFNGGRWRVPPGLTPIPDEFGGAAGLLVVP